MPTTRQPLIFAIWPTTVPTAPAAPETTTVSPGCGLPISSRPKYAVMLRHAERAEKHRQRRDRGIDFAQPLAVERRVFLDAERAIHEHRQT